MSTGDDAAVYVLPGGVGLVQTVDFFTPIVDDPFDWGRIAAANAFSDVYAMGGRPVTALNLVAWPVKELPLDLLARVLEGGAALAKEAGVAIVGGHSIHDPEPKYGMAVTGLIDPDRVVRNSTVRPDDRLFLTKPLGLGIISTAIKAGAATPEQLESAIETMTTLNAAGSRRPPSRCCRASSSWPAPGRSRRGPGPTERSSGRTRTGASCPSRNSSSWRTPRRPEDC